MAKVELNGGWTKPLLWMKPSDVCEVELEGIGTLRNPVVDQGAIGVESAAHAAVA